MLLLTHQQAVLSLCLSNLVFKRGGRANQFKVFGFRLTSRVAGAFFTWRTLWCGKSEPETELSATVSDQPLSEYRSILFCSLVGASLS